MFAFDPLLGFEVVLVRSLNLSSISLGTLPVVRLSNHVEHKDQVVGLNVAMTQFSLANS